MKKLILSLALLAASSAQASTYTGLVKRLHPFKNGAVHIVLVGSQTGTRPGCGSGINGFALDTNTQGGRAQLDMIRAAWAMDQSVVLRGTANSCPTLANTIEELDYPEVGQQ